MESRRQPLKRLCSDSENDLPRKKRFNASEEEMENRDPGELEGKCRDSWSSLLRITEQEIKPDTPAIPSIISRIQMLKDSHERDLSLDFVEEGQSEADDRKDDSGQLQPDLDQEGEIQAECSTEGLNKKQLAEGLVPLAQSTLATRHPLPSLEDDPPSVETASRLRKERQEEVDMVCAVVDRSNPWRAVSMRQRKRPLEQVGKSASRKKRRRRVKTGRGRVKMGPMTDDSSGSESTELSLESNEGSLDVSTERCVSSLEIRLQRTCSNDSLPPEELPSSFDVADEDGSREAVDNGDQRRVTMNSSELIDRIFEGVLDVSELSEEHFSDEVDLPPVSILSPLTKSADLQAAISPLGSVVSSLPELLEEEPTVKRVTSAEEEVHLPYSIDAYRTLRRNVQLESISQLCTPTTSRHPERRLLVKGDAKERIKFLSKEVSSLQRIIEQSCCALSYCVDVDHGKGTRQEAEAERLLLVSTEKKVALLKELDRLRGERSEELESCPSEELRPCHGSVTISDIQLPLKVDYVCKAIRDSGSLGHYFLILIRYGSYDVVATPLASAADAQTGDTIIFPTSVTLNKASADFRIEIEVYSLAQSGPITTVDKRKSLKPKITPKKLLGSRKTSLNSPAFSPAVNCPLRSSSFLLVGSLTLSLESLGKFKFPLDKVPFLSPLEGNLYLKMQCQSHSAVQRTGFLTIFDDVSGLGAWHRRWCVLSGSILSFWAYPDQEASKEPLGRTNLVNCTSAKIEAAKRDACARPHTLELITMRPQQEDDRDTLVTQCRNTLCFTKNWLSADTKEERDLWMDCLNQVLLDLRTWGASLAKLTPS
ncbi:anillin-like isoform X2 [Rana temporaria]|uniref:anillin-like isoform X2 n=1 Tax=Rana temporaria TaxID=8407 RepID=UPI001AACD2D3|nr:anillin-like isoform X2 [Rana temporaria]